MHTKSVPVNSRSFSGYDREGFLALQHAVNLAILKYKGGDNVSEFLDNLSFDIRRHPYPKFNDDNFILVIQQQLPLILMLSFVLVALNIVKDVVHEKERKLKVVLGFEMLFDKLSIAKNQNLIAGLWLIAEIINCVKDDLYLQV